MNAVYVIQLVNVSLAVFSFTIPEILRKNYANNIIIQQIIIKLTQILHWLSSCLTRKIGYCWSPSTSNQNVFGTVHIVTNFNISFWCKHCMANNILHLVL